MNQQTRLLSVTLFVLLCTLVLTLYLSDRSISRFMENCGDFISTSFGY